MTFARRNLLKGMAISIGAALAEPVRALGSAQNLSFTEVAPRRLMADAPAASPPQSTPGKLAVFPNDALPTLRMLIDMPLRDTSVCRGPDGVWYLTGTIPPFWSPNEGIKIWKSKDMINWESLGLVWRYGASPWHKQYIEAKRPLWAPEIHYLKGTFWLTYSMPGWDGTPKTSGCGLLRSTSGKVQGPYEDVHPGERLGDEIDASLFQDDDGVIYFLWHSGKIARMNDDMTGLAEPYHWLRTSGNDPNPAHHAPNCSGIFGKNSFHHIGFEGAYLFKANGHYYFSCAEIWDGRYSCCTSMSERILGPYTPRYESIPHGGHNVFFQDELGAWWSTYFGNDGNGAPWREKPGVLPISFDELGRIHAKVNSSAFRPTQISEREDVASIKSDPIRFMAGLSRLEPAISAVTDPVATASWQVRRLTGADSLHCVT